MAHKSIGYHTRPTSNNSIKYSGGSFGGSFDMETINRLVRAHFEIRIHQGSGRPVFVDRNGRDVWLYITVDPEKTEKGEQAMFALRVQQQQRERHEAEKQSRLESVMNNYTTDELLKLLSPGDSNAD